MELHHAGALRLEGADEIGGERFHVGEHDRAVGRAGVRGNRVGLGLAAAAITPSEEELDLVRAAQLEAEARQPLEHPLRERPAAGGVRLSLLIPLVDGRERPPGARRERHGRVHVGHQPRVPGRPADVLRRGDLIVDHEHREHWRQTDPEPGRLLQPADRHGLDERDARVVDHRQGDGLHPGVRQTTDGRGRRGAGRTAGRHGA
jgi:hypothetical protein